MELVSRKGVLQDPRENRADREQPGEMNQCLPSVSHPSPSPGTCSGEGFDVSQPSPSSSSWWLAVAGGSAGPGSGWGCISQQPQSIPDLEGHFRAGTNPLQQQHCTLDTVQFSRRSITSFFLAEKFLTKASQYLL